MPTTTQRTSVPRGLGAQGRKLYRSVADDYELTAAEALVLLQAARTADRLEDLASALASAPLTVTNYKGDAVAHPLLVEQRQQAQTLTRLIASLRLPDDDEDTGEGRRPQRRGGARGPYGVRGLVVGGGAG